MFKYTISLQWSEEDDGYIALVPELPGVSAFGETPDEALKEACISTELYIETLQENEEPIPTPKIMEQFSGQFRLRLPKSLHRRVSLLAESEGVSLNSFISSVLSEKLGSENKPIFAPAIQPIFYTTNNFSVNMPQSKTESKDVTSKDTAITKPTNNSSDTTKRVLLRAVK